MDNNKDTINYMIYEMYERETYKKLDSEIIETKYSKIKDIIYTCLINYITDEIFIQDKNNTKYVMFYNNDKMKFTKILTMIYIINYKYYNNDFNKNVETQDDIIKINVKDLYKWKNELDNEVINNKIEELRSNKMYTDDYLWTIAAYNKKYNKITNKEYNLENIFNLKKYYNKNICPFAHKFMLDKKLIKKNNDNIIQILNLIPLIPEKK